MNSKTTVSTHPKRELVCGCGQTQELAKPGTLGPMTISRASNAGWHKDERGHWRCPPCRSPTERGRPFTGEQIRERYIRDLEKLFSVRSRADRELYAKAELTWSFVNHGYIHWPDPETRLWPRFVTIFGQSDVVWMIPCVQLVDGCLAIDILLVDYYEGPDHE